MTTKPNPTGTASGDRPLRVAVPNKGSLSQSAQEILRESGYRQRHDPKELRLIDRERRRCP